MNILAPIMPALGIDFALETGFYVAATFNPVTRGQMLDVDIGGDSSGSTGDNVGGRSDRLARTIEPQGFSYQGGVPQVIALESCIAGQVFRAVKTGIIRVLVYGEYSAGNIIIQNRSGGGTNGSRVRGFILESGGVAGQASYAKVLFDGETGFGTLVGASPPGGDPTYPVGDSVGVYDPTPGGADDPDAPLEGGTVFQGAVTIPVGIAIT